MPVNRKLLNIAGAVASIDNAQARTVDTPKEQQTIVSPRAVDTSVEQRLLNPGVPGKAVNTPSEQKADNRDSVPKPSLAAAVDSSPGDTNQPLYPEEDAIRSALNNSSVVNQTMQNLGSMSASERANKGALYGAGVGLQAGGPVGSVIGMAIGSMAGRAAGMVQAGEYEDGKRKGVVLDTLNTLKAIDDKGFFNFEDGTKFFVNPDPTATLTNTSAVTGKPTRTMFEMDTTNPFTKRSAAVARPLAYFLSQGLLKYSNPDKDERDKSVLNSTTSLLVNAIQKDAGTITEVYSRAQELASKFGVTKEGMETFFNSIKTTIPDGDAQSIRQGLDILFVGEDNG